MIVFASRTGNVRSIVQKLPINTVEIVEDLKINEPYFVFTYTDGIGEVPKKVESFLTSNSNYLRGVISSGNTNFGIHYTGSADKISSIYGVPIIRRIDLRGSEADIDAIVEAYKNRIEGGNKE